MTITHIRVSHLTPILPALDPATGALHLNDVGDTITVTCPPWTFIRTDQRVALHIDGEVAAEEPVPELRERLGRPPVFTVPVAQYFQPGQTATIHLVVTQPDGSDNPNSARTRSLSFAVV